MSSSASSSCRCCPAPVPGGNARVLCCVARQTSQCLVNQSIIDQTATATLRALYGNFGTSSPQAFDLEDPANPMTLLGSAIARLQSSRAPRGVISVLGTFEGLTTFVTSAVLRVGESGADLFSLNFSTITGGSSGQYGGDWAVPNATLLDTARTGGIFLILSNVLGTTIARGRLILSEAPLVFASAQSDVGC